MSKNLWTRQLMAACLVMLLVCTAAGCSGARQLIKGELQEPKVNLQGIIIHPPTSECWPLGVRLKVENPNDEPLQLSGYDYEVWLDGQRVVLGESRDRVTLPARGETVVEVPVLVKLESVPRVLLSVLQRKRIAYEVAGGVRLTPLAGGLLRVPFRFRGDLSETEGLDHLRGLLPGKK